jgi:hypothetical protein
VEILPQREVAGLLAVPGRVTASVTR